MKITCISTSSSEQLKTEHKKCTIFTGLKHMKSLCINVTKYEQDLYVENYKTPISERNQIRLNYTEKYTGS